jgi:hypothetical protein
MEIAPTLPPAALLARYIEAKDLVCPHLTRQIYAPDAVLTYSLATDSIRFPARVSWLEGITHTLVVDFATRYSGCKTYCVVESPPELPEELAFVPWLVLMREQAAASLRIGKGFYEWTLDDGGFVVAMHIHIERMDAIDDRDGALLQSAQAVLPYPWLPPQTLRSEFEALMKRGAGCSFLEAFKVPLSRGSAHRSGAAAGR